MNDRAVIGAGTVGAVLAVICCAAPLLAVGLPLAGLGAWLADAGRVLLPLVVSGIALVAWGLHHRLAKPRATNGRFTRKAGSHERLLRIFVSKQGCDFHIRDAAALLRAAGRDVSGLVGGDVADGPERPARHRPR